MRTAPEELMEERTAYGRREWNETWSIMSAGKRNWQIMAAIEGIALIVSISGLIYLGSLPKEMPYVVEVNKDTGITRTLGRPETMSNEVWDKVRAESVRRFIEHWRTVTVDQSAQTLMFRRAFAYIGDGSPAATMLSSWYSEHDPLQRGMLGELVSVSVMPNTFQPEGDHTYGMLFRENITMPGGQPPVSKLYRARIVYTMQIPKKEDAKVENGLGVMITNLTFSEVPE
jgi:type IV secretory pathway TrbF-like protein